MAVDIKTWGEARLSLLRRDLDERFDALCADLGLPALPGAGGVRVIDRGDAFEVSARLPGFTASEIEIAATRRVLAIFGQCAAAAPGVRGKRSFRREVRLPADVVPEAASAAFANGLLTVRLPRRNPLGNLPSHPTVAIATD